MKKKLLKIPESVLRKAWKAKMNVLYREIPASQRPQFNYSPWHQTAMRAAARVILEWERKKK